MKLRKWQVESTQLALDHYQKSSKHFLCLATPGAGKTVMAAEVAARLYEQDKIDFVIFFLPQQQYLKVSFIHLLTDFLAALMCSGLVNLTIFL